MPRKRHDSSDEESDNSRGARNQKSKKSSNSRDKKQKDTKKTKNRNVSESSSDASPIKQKSSDRKKDKKRHDSESDNSPVKKSVQSRVQKPGDRGGRLDPRDTRGRQSEDGPMSGSDTSPEKRRKRGPQLDSPPAGRARGGNRQKNGSGGTFRSASPDPPHRSSLDRFSRRDERQVAAYDDRLDFERRDMADFGRDRVPLEGRDRPMMYDRRDFRDGPPQYGSRDRMNVRDFDRAREPMSPERGFPSRRDDPLSPPRRHPRDDMGYMPYGQRDSSFEQDQRFPRRQSLSPVRRLDRDRRNSPGPLNRSFENERQRPVSLERGSRRQRSLGSFSPDTRRGRTSIEMDRSPVRERRSDRLVLDDITSPETKGKSAKPNKKKKNSKKDSNDKVTGKSSREQRQDRSESLERSFERSKQSLVIPDDDRAILKESKSELKKNTGKDGKKSGKKNAAKRPRSSSGSPQRLKKSKENDESVTEKKGKKKGKKDKEKISKSVKRNSRSRSKSVDSLTLTSMKKGASKQKNSSKAPKTSRSKRSPSRSVSPLERSRRSTDLDRSRTSDVSFSRKHDMTQFESEPESGEITDSEEEGKNALKSQVKKPLDEAEEKHEQEEDEKYWNEKRKASRKREEELTRQPSSRSNKEESKKDHGGKRSRTGDDKKSSEGKSEAEPVGPPAKKPKPEGAAAFTGRTGGAYIPPARLRAMQASITDKSSVEYQRISWEALKKSINGLVNKVNVSNIENIVRELFQENIVRGRGLLARSIIQAQSASPTFTHVYAALVSIVNTKFPQNGELVLRRLVMQFRRGYKRNDKTICLSSTRFVAHLVNQQVAHEVLALEILTLLLEEPTDDSVEVSIGFLKECGQKLTDVSPRGINAIFERLRNVLHEGLIDKRVQYMIEVMFAVRKDQFKDFPALVGDLDLVEEEDQFTHLLTLEDAGNGEELLNVFRPDPSFQENEEKYKILKKEILGEESSDEEDGSGNEDDDDDDDEDSSEEDEQADEEKKQTVIDNTETNMIALRRTIYLTIQSSLDFEECAHKLLKMDLKPGQEIELCNMILDCCAQMRTYEKFFGLLAGRFCSIDKKYIQPFENMFKEQYDTIHRLETNKLRNVAKFFAHLLFTDSISWAVLSSIKLNEEDTTSASRIFIKILFQELSEYLGLPKLNGRLKDPTLLECFVGLMPRENPRDTRFAINFFTTIGLGGLTDDLREHLKDISKKLMQQKQDELEKAAVESDNSSESSDSDSDSSSESEKSSSSDSSSDSESSEDEKSKRKKKKANEKPKGKDKRKEKEKVASSKGKQREKERRRGKDTEKDTYVKEGRKENKKDNKKSKRNQSSEVEQQKERDRHFKRLARLANYDEEIIEPVVVPSKRSMEREERSSRKAQGQENGESRRDRRRMMEDREFDRGDRDREFRSSDLDRRDFDDDRYGRGGGERMRERDLYDDRLGLDRSYEGGYEREDRFEGLDKRRGSGKRGKDYLDFEQDDPSIRVERNFERLDIYEEKFERDRARNMQYARERPEFEEYYEGREERQRRSEREELRKRDVVEEDPGFDARKYRDRVPVDDRRRNRSEERVPREGGRRRR